VTISTHQYGRRQARRALTHELSAPAAAPSATEVLRRRHKPLVAWVISVRTLRGPIEGIDIWRQRGKSTSYLLQGATSRRGDEGEQNQPRSPFRFGSPVTGPKPGPKPGPEVLGVAVRDNAWFKRLSRGIKLKP